jgi:NAD(P)H-flavin reductase
MYQIIKKLDLAPSIKLMKVTAPEVAKKARAGQFIILRMHDRDERIPLTVAASVIG